MILSNEKVALGELEIGKGFATYLDGPVHVVKGVKSFDKESGLWWVVVMFKATATTAHLRSDTQVHAVIEAKELGDVPEDEIVSLYIHGVEFGEFTEVKCTMRQAVAAEYAMHSILGEDIVACTVTSEVQNREIRQDELINYHF